MDRPLNFHHLHYFRVIAEVMGIAEAARILGVGSSTLSAQLRVFEADLGVTLFHRQGKRLELTPEGRIVLEHARSIMAEGKDLRRRLKSHELRRDLHLVVGSDVPAESLSTVLESALKLGLNSVQVERVLGTSSAVLLGRRYDAALFVNPLPERGYREVTLSEHPLRVCEARATSPTEAVRVFVLPPRESPRRLPVQEWLKRAGVEPKFTVEINEVLPVRLPRMVTVTFSPHVPTDHQEISVIDGYRERVCLLAPARYQDPKVKEFFGQFPDDGKA